jgi:hypothetical protein
MPIPVTKMESNDDHMHCPITGELVSDPDGGVRNVPTLLFVHVGDVDNYLYISDRLVKLLLASGVDCDSDDIPISPSEIAMVLDLEGAQIIAVDGGWNGVNCDGFAPCGITSDWSTFIPHRLRSKEPESFLAWGLFTRSDGGSPAQQLRGPVPRILNHPRDFGPRCVLARKVSLHCLPRSMLPLLLAGRILLHHAVEFCPVHLVAVCRALREPDDRTIRDVQRSQQGTVAIHPESHVLAFEGTRRHIDGYVMSGHCDSPV